MSVEFIGFITNNNASETIVRSGAVIDRPYLETVAKAHEVAGFDRALLAFHSTTPDCQQIAQHVLGITDRLKVLIAQRPGFTAPTLIARQLATIDQLSGGRVALHVITGGNAAELKQDGNTIDDKDERYARTDEFLDVVRAEWSSEKPFSYQGKYYRVENGFSQVKPYHSTGIPIFVGGASDAAIEVAGKHADTFALWGESYAQVRDVTSRVRVAAEKHGRPTPRRYSTITQAGTRLPAANPACGYRERHTRICGPLVVRLRPRGPAAAVPLLCLTTLPAPGTTAPVTCSGTGRHSTTPGGMRPGTARG